MEPAKKPQPIEDPKTKARRSHFRHGEGYKVVLDHDPPNNPINDRNRLEEQPITDVPETSDEDNAKNVVLGSVWMVILALGLFFLPAVNGVFAGMVGGYMVGSTKRALMAAIIPAFIIAGGLWVLLATLDFPVVGFFIGAALAIHITLSEIGLFLGAAIGGAVAQTNIDKFNRA
jgi:hypothetical protein